MTTTLPLQVTITQETRTSGSQQLTGALRPWQQRVMLRHILTWGGAGLMAGLVLACLLLIIARLLPWGSVHYWIAGSLPACLLIALGLALWTRPTLSSTTDDIDRLLGLHNRLGTAWELREQSSPLVMLQRKDAL